MLHRALRITAWLMLVVVVRLDVDPLGDGQQSRDLDGRLDWFMWLLQILAAGRDRRHAALAVGTPCRCSAAPNRRWVATIWAVVAALAALFLVWLAFDLSLINFSMNF